MDAARTMNQLATDASRGRITETTAGSKTGAKEIIDLCSIDDQPLEMAHQSRVASAPTQLLSGPSEQPQKQQQEQSQIQQTQQIQQQQSSSSNSSSKDVEVLVTTANGKAHNKPTIDSVAPLALEKPKDQVDTEHKALHISTTDRSRHDNTSSLQTKRNITESAETRTSTVENNRKDKNRYHKKLWSGSIQVQIPLSVTIDFGVLAPRIRTKRRKVLENMYPSMRATEDSESKSTHNDDAIAKKPIGGQTSGKDVLIQNGDGGTNPASSNATTNNSASDTVTNAASAKASRAETEAKLQRNGYSSFVDYLEAKYSQGVMLDQGDRDASSVLNDDKDEGNGSVYSQDSFFDDTDLQRNVAEQVLAHSTATKLELQDHDNEFFVNVGALEVEETEMTADNYDPLKDVDVIKRRRKRKLNDNKDKSDTAGQQSNGKKAKISTTNTNAKANVSGNAATNNDEKSAKSRTESKSKVDDSQKKTVLSKPKDPVATSEADTLEKMEEHIRQDRHQVDEFIEKLRQHVVDHSSDDLPRRKTKVKVALTCSEDKKPGDMVTFSNPHMPGQRLRVKIPPNIQPGGSFKVSVPIEEKVDPEKDYNKWSKAFYDDFDRYTVAYDNWVDTTTELKVAQKKKDYSLPDMKRRKFDELLQIFPEDLKTPVTVPYLQKIFRRARQSRLKRERVAFNHDTILSAEPEKNDSNGATLASASASATNGNSSKLVNVKLPQFSENFDVQHFSVEDFPN